jgi:alpha-beta hydrolase superfamily lysophospholipase
MKRVIALAAACAAAFSAGVAGGAEERWEFVLGGAVAGSETVEESAQGFSGAGAFTFQGTKIESSYRIDHDVTGAPALYTLALTVPGAKVTIASSVAAGQLTLTVSQNGAVAGTKAFPLSPSLVILDNNVFGQYRQLARLLSPEGPARVNVQMLVPQVLTLIPLEAARQPGTWRWSAAGASGTAVLWELSSPAPLLLKAWQDLASGRIVQVQIPQARTLVRLAGLSIAAEASAASSRPAYLATPVEEKDVTIVSGRYRLGATVTRAKSATARLPGVVIVGGSGPTDRDGEVGGTKVYRDLALGLAAKGFAVLRFDKRTYAYRDNIAVLEADRMGLREEYLEDTEAALRLLAADPWVDASRLTLVGHSLGAWVLPLVVEKLGGSADMVKRLVLVAPPGKDMGATLVRQLRFRLSLNPGEPALERTIADTEAAFATYRATGSMPGPVLGGRAFYWQDMLGADPIGAASRLAQPLLIFRGAKDFQVDASDVADWQRVLGGRAGVSFGTLADLNHLLVVVPEGPSTGVEYFREGWVSPAAIEAVAAGLAR